ncbi:hypothetical protein DRP77_02755 [Candidatus Poribacteria bacterium]|nr:MAG: hypothetical protein DRP77_02755 [Candidatus Poribacteria bacterium]
MRGRIHVVPQSHIDVAWLWRYDPETIHRCCRPTFSLALRNMERYPDYTFAQSQVPLYRAMEELYPEIFEEIRRRVREGRWEIVGGMYVEFEGGEPCGESLVRQFVMGKRYFLEKFGVEVTTAWQEDAWSHPWQLPQIMRKCGIDSYMFKRGEKGERLFWWEAPDGSRVLACKPLHDLTPSERWVRFFEEMSERYGVRDVMIRIGRGDHGGGPTPEEIEAVRSFAEEARPELEVRFGTFRGFVDAILSQNPDLPVLRDELGFELVGDLTNCGEIKRMNRRCENLLLATEKLRSVASIQLGLPYPAEELYEDWRKLLFNQFHDIIGGSGIPPVCRDAMAFYEMIEESCSKLLEEGISALAGEIDTRGEGKAVLLFNALSWDRTGPVELDIPEGAELKVLNAEGREIPCQMTAEGRLFFIAEEVPSIGYRLYRLAEGEPPRFETDLSVSGLTLENKFLRVEIDPETGYLRSVFDKSSGRELVEEGRLANLIVAIEDEGDSEGRFVKGSDTIARPPGRAHEVMGEPVIEVLERGPLRARVRISRGFESSTFAQEVMLYAGMRRVDFKLIVDWHDVHWMIKIAFPLRLENPTVTYETAYGTIVRPADGLEYPAQRWVDLSEEGFGAALLNDSRYGHDVEGSTLRMSVLRSPTEPAYNTDEGRHEINYSLIPHEGDWRDGEVMRRGCELNGPLITAVIDPHPGRLPPQLSFVRIRPRNVILEVFKRAYDSDGFVLRAYEFEGRACEAAVETAWPIGSAALTDMMERVMGEVGFEGGRLRFEMGAYEIKTIKVDFGR